MLSSLITGHPLSAKPLVSRGSVYCSSLPKFRYQNQPSSSIHPSARKSNYIQIPKSPIGSNLDHGFTPNEKHNVHVPVGQETIEPRRPPWTMLSTASEMQTQADHHTCTVACCLLHKDSFQNAPTRPRPSHDCRSQISTTQDRRLILSIAIPSSTLEAVPRARTIWKTQPVACRFETRQTRTPRRK